MYAEVVCLKKTKAKALWKIAQEFISSKAFPSYLVLKFIPKRGILIFLKPRSEPIPNVMSLLSQHGAMILRHSNLPGAIQIKTSHQE